MYFPIFYQPLCPSGHNFCGIDVFFETIKTDMKKSILILTAAIVAVLPLKAGGQVNGLKPVGIARPEKESFSAAPYMAMTLSEAQQYAVENNRTLKNASLDIRKARASKWQAIASMLPQVKGSVDYSNTLGFKMSFGGQSIAMPPYATMGLQTAIAFNGAMVVATQVAGISQKMADINFRQTEKDLKDQVKTLYISALVSQTTLLLMEESLASLEKLYEISVSSVKAGVSEQTDADQLQVQVAGMENNVEYLKRSLEVIYNTIRLTLCLNENTRIVLSDSLDTLINLDSAGKLVGEEFDITRNFSFQLLQQSTELARKQVVISALSNTPTLSIFHQYSNKQYFSDEKTMNMTPPNMIGATLSIPIFTSLKNSAAHKEAKIAYEKQLNTMADTELALKLQHSQYVYNLTSAIEKYRTQKQSVEVAKRVFDNIGKKYEFGVASALELTNASTSLINAQSAYVESLLQVVTAQIDLEKLLNN